MKNKEQLITIPLDDLIWCILGNDESGPECNPISHDMAMALEQYLQHSSKYIIIWTTREDEPLEYPMLWRIKFWNISENKYLRVKAYEEKERIASMVRQKNENNLVRVLLKEGFTEEQAKKVAYKFVSKNNKDVLTYMGLKQIAEGEEDLK